MPAFQELRNRSTEGCLLRFREIVEMNAAATTRLALGVPKTCQRLETLKPGQGHSQLDAFARLDVRKQFVDDERHAPHGDVHNGALDFDETLAEVDLHFVVGGRPDSDILATLLHPGVIGWGHRGETASPAGQKQGGLRPAPGCVEEGAEATQGLWP